jgi:hypothetical protein
MSEFYIDISEDIVDKLVADKLAMYDTNITSNMLQGHGFVVSHNHFVYVNYAKYHGKELGTFELMRYTATYNGMDIYCFYVEREPTEETNKIIEKRNKLHFDLVEGMKLKRKFKELSARDLNKELSKRGIYCKQRKNVKLDVIVEYELDKMWSDEKIRNNRLKAIVNNDRNFHEKK